MLNKPWRHESQHDHFNSTVSRTARIERSFGVQWKYRIFARDTQNADMQRAMQLLPIGAQDMPELRVLVQPMFQQHYIYFMAHRYLHENMVVGADYQAFDILTTFTKRYSNPNASEIRLLTQFYFEVDEERLKKMTLADCAVRFLLDCKTWERPTDSQHFSKACSFASRPKKAITVGSDGKGGLLPLMDQ